ncbi:MAG: sigma-70 family RNA polymerase sigma factor [Hyphomonas sp.]
MTALKRSSQSAATISDSRLCRVETVGGARPESLSIAVQTGSTTPHHYADTQESPATERFAADLIVAMKTLRRYALWLSGSVSQADDLMQDAMLNAWQARDRFEHGTNLNAWCRTILRNVHLSHLRRSWRILPLADETMATLPAIDGDFTSALDLLSVRNSIALLPIEQREALLLVGAGGMSYIEAARIAGCAVGTMKSRVSRARAQLSVLMSENRTGFSTDAVLRAKDVLDDLLCQVDRIKLKAVPAGQRVGEPASVEAVFSEAEPMRLAVLSKG